jgi:dihydrofolate reductase
MRKLFTFFFASLDGYHESAGHDLSWHLADEEFDVFDLAQLGEVDTFLLGRVTYEQFVEFWPTAEAYEVEPVRAKLFNETPKVVVSRTLREAAWENTTVIGENVDAEIRALKEQPGREIGVFGSAKLTAYLVQAGLVDELRVLVNPVLVGDGIPAFPVSGLVSLELLDTRRFGNGNMLLTYRPMPDTVAD